MSAQGDTEDWMDAPDAPTFHFFRNVPSDISKTPPLTSSLQTLETCFILISFRRYPHALLACVSAIESAIRAKLKAPEEDQTPLVTLIEDIRKLSHNLRLFDRRKLDKLRDMRNHIAHYGFIPADDDKSVRLLLQTGLPFLRKCYRELFGFYLDWREVRPGLAAFSNLSNREKERVWLNPKVADQLRVAWDVFSKVKELRGIDLTYCFKSFGHFIRLWLRHEIISAIERDPPLKEQDTPRPSYRDMYTDWDWTDEQCAHGQENPYWSERLKAEKRALEMVFKFPWPFDCPLCDGEESVIADLDYKSLCRGRAVVHNANCASCGLVVSDEMPYLGQRLFEDQALAKQNTIFEKLGSFPKNRRTKE